jgi:hypothetical protein
MRTRRPKAAFVVTVSLLGSVLGTGCGKSSSSSSSGECKPPECHMNPPPPPPTTVPISANPPAIQPDAGAPNSVPVAK